MTERAPQPTERVYLEALAINAMATELHGETIDRGYERSQTDCAGLISFFVDNIRRDKPEKVDGVIDTAVLAVDAKEKLYDEARIIEKDFIRHAVDFYLHSPQPLTPEEAVDMEYSVCVDDQNDSPPIPITAV